MSIITAIKTRNSNAFMSEREVDPDLIRQILDAAVCTPVDYRTDPWRFLVIRGAGRKRLGDVMAAHMAKGMTDPNSAKNMELLEKMRKKSLRAPVVIVVGAARTDCAQALVVEDVALVSASCQNILLAADALGLSAIWRTGSLAYAEDTALAGFIYLGYPAKEMTPKPRPTSENFTRWMND